eukprot:jgi/Mesen1/6061/ME000031S05334
MAAVCGSLSAFSKIYTSFQKPQARAERQRFHVSATSGIRHCRLTASSKSKFGFSGTTIAQDVLVDARAGRTTSLKASESQTGDVTVATEGNDNLSAEDTQDIQDIFRVVELLQRKRDMTFNELRLTVMIEDPREVERRRQLGIEDERGCSREDLADALLEVYEGKVPADRVVLHQLAEEFRNWPNLDQEEAAEARSKAASSPYAAVTKTGVDPKIAAQRARADQAWDAALETTEKVEEKSLSDVLPPWVGYGFLYTLSVIPIIIGVVVVVVLFLNSLQ